MIAEPIHLEISDAEQGSEEWLRNRMGIPTASRFSDVMAKGRGGAPSKTRRTYMLTLIGEQLTGEPAISFSNGHMERGHALEPEARDLYAMRTDTDPVPVGFVRRGRTGGSPDALVGDHGLLEIKTKLPHLQLALLLDGEVPSEHEQQIQGLLWITGRDWCDFVSYWPGLPPFIRRVERDEERIAEIEEAVEQFLQEMDELSALLTVA